MRTETTYRQRKIDSEVITVMFIDIAGYTSASAKMSRDEFFELHNTFDSLALPLFNQFFGTVVKKMGDAFLVTFKSPTDAVLCGVELQKSFRRYNYIQQDNSKKINIRVAIHTGEVILKDRDVYGDAVNTASRIESIARPGHVVFSEAVFSAMNKKEVPIVFLGAHRLRGLNYPVKLFRVRTWADEVRRRVKVIKRVVTTVISIGILAGLLYFTVDYVIPAVL